MVYTKEAYREPLLGLGAKENVQLSGLTTFRVGGTADFVLETGEEAVLAEALSLCREGHIPCALLGNGSNVLAGEEGFSGLVLKILPEGKEPVFEGCRVTVSAGASLTALARESLRRGLMGLERLGGIPGTIGGAIAMNAGAYGGQIVDVLRRVKLFREGKILWEDVNAEDFGYRKSPYSWPKAVVLEAELALSPDDGTAKETMERCYKARREKQPLEYPSAGSYFKRPVGHFAGALIEQCGLKGATVGGAQVSQKHAGFLINVGNATADDVQALEKLVRDKVLLETGVELEREVKLLEETACIF